MAKRRRKKKRGRKKILLFVFEILLLLVVLGVLWAYNQTLGQVKYEDGLTVSEAGINEDIDEDALANMHGYLNVALFGLDNRSNGSYNEGNSDCIMIASLNYDTKEVQIVSVYRDTYLSSGSGKYTKANAAYAGGGAKRAVAMLNSNLDLDITKYICVDWKALVDAIDDIGGIDLEITKAEMDEINYLIPEVDGTTGYNTNYLEDTGLQHLNGTQATCYARIRNTSGDDFLRASRQRIVLQAMLDKAKQSDIGSLTEMCKDIMSQISTNFTAAEILQYASAITQYEMKETTGFPFELTTMNLSSTGDTVIPIDLAQNVSELHQFLFNETDYQPSETVQSVSSKIEKKTGVTAKTSAFDLTQYNNTVGSDGTEGTKQKNKAKQEETDKTKSDDSTSDNSDQ
ncbi:LCP family protein [Agathobacter sp.]